MSKFGSFDPDSFGLGGFLDGRKGRITALKFHMFDYNGQYDATPRLSVDITRLNDEGEEDGTRTEGYGIGGAVPSADGNNYEGKFTNKARASKFFKALKASGYEFPAEATGIDALVGEVFEWKHIPIEKSENDFAVPVKHVGSAEEDAVDEADSEFRVLLVDLVKEAVTAAPLKKLAVQKAVSPMLNGNPNKNKALTLMISDSFYQGTGVLKLEGGVVSLAA